MPLGRKPTAPPVLTPPLAHRVANPATGAKIAAALGAIWAEIETALSPIVGVRGVAALLQRSLHLASASHPWLAAGRSTAPLDPASLMALLAQRSDEEAANAAEGLLQTFRQLLASLIGPALTERLLRTVWGPPIAPSSGSPAQDPTS